jgi:Fe-Mn family superoxide dismutase
MKKRTFLKTGLVLGLGAAFSPVAQAFGGEPEKSNLLPTKRNMPPFELPPLPYGYNALEPLVDTLTMQVHHDKHHAAYVNNLNAALEDSTMKGMVIEDILRGVDKDAKVQKLRNNAGGHYNHNLFWQLMTPGGKPLDPGSKLYKAIMEEFGAYANFEKLFKEAAKGVFGSGWAWLCAGPGKKLYISQTPNQDNPLMVNLVDNPGVPLLGIDVWEHAYYLKHQNRRADYTDAFMQLVNWDTVEKRFSAL